MTHRSSVLLLLLLWCATTCWARIGETTPSERDLLIDAEIYGRWCGKGHGYSQSQVDNDTTGYTDPVDDFDAACKAHDLCYERKGWMHCNCEDQFLQTAANPNICANANNPSACDAAKTAGIALLAGSRATACFCHKRIRIKIAGIKIRVKRKFYGLSC